MQTFKIGDWYCPSCKLHNFAKNNSCKDCGKSNPNSTITKEIGDWNCSCGEMNFKSRVVCRKCGELNEKTNNVKAKNIYVPEQNDWKCVCGEMNFKFRTMCRKCNIKRSTTDNFVVSKLNVQKKQQTLPPTIEISENDLCIICMEKEKTTAIKKCGHFLYCNECGKLTNKCPACRTLYLESDLLRIYNL